MVLALKLQLRAFDLVHQGSLGISYSAWGEHLEKMTVTETVTETVKETAETLKETVQGALGSSDDPREL